MSRTGTGSRPQPVLVGVRCRGRPSARVILVRTVSDLVEPRGGVFVWARSSSIPMKGRLMGAC
jgi:hypothetical protein